MSGLSDVVYLVILVFAMVVGVLLGLSFVWLRRRQQQIPQSGATRGYAGPHSGLEAGDPLRLGVNQLLEQSDSNVSRLRSADNATALSGIRNELLQQLLSNMCSLTGASRGHIFRTINAYHKSSGKLDRTYGSLVELISVPQATMANRSLRHFSVGQLSPEILKLFPTEQSRQIATSSEYNKYAFNATSPKPADPFLDPASRSGMLIPLYEGINVVGLMCLESPDERYFSLANSTLVDACEQVAWMASDIIDSAKMRLEDLQSDALLDVYEDIMYMKRADIDEFMKKCLLVATRLTAHRCDWAQILLIRHYAHDQDKEAQRIEKSYGARLGEGGQVAWEESNPRGINFNEDYPLVTYPAYRRVITRRSSHLNVDLQTDSEFKERRDLPWANAHSFICIPLIRPVDDLDDKKERRVFGLLSLAAVQPCMFNDSDDRVLSDYAQAIPLGVRNIELLEEASGLVEDVEHNIFKSVMPLYEEVNLKDPQDWDTQRVRNLANLTRDLVRWFFALAYEDANLDDKSGEQVTDVSVLLERLRTPVETLGSVVSGRTFHIRIAPGRRLAVLSGKRRGRYLRAALFHYLENGFKYDQNHDIELEASYVEREGKPYVRFDVITRGTRVPEAQVPLLFKRGFRASLTPNGDGLGLYQVRRISKRLGGLADYRYEAPDRNIFFILVPWVDAGA